MFKRILFLTIVLHILLISPTIGAAAIVSSPVPVLPATTLARPASLPTLEPPANPLEQIPTEGGSVFYNRKLLMQTLGRTKQVLLTFDDGPNPLTTPVVLETLKRHGLKAVFFVTGMNVRKYPALVKRISEEGHTLGNHTYFHPNLTHFHADRILKEIRDTNELIRQITGVRPTLFRPPYGAINQQVLNTLQQEHMDVMLWTIDPGDWRNRNINRTMENLKRQMQFAHGGRGGVVLLHDTLSSSAHALEPFLNAMKAYGLLSASFEGRPVCTDKSYWHAEDIQVARWGEFQPTLNLTQIRRPYLKMILEDGKPVDFSALALLRAKKSGDLRRLMLANR